MQTVLWSGQLYRDDNNKATAGNLAHIPRMAAGWGAGAAGGKTVGMSTPHERIIHCCGCNHYVIMPDEAQEGDVISCPFCQTKNRLRLLTVYVGDPVEEA